MVSVAIALAAIGCEAVVPPHGDPVATLSVSGSGTVSCTFPEHGCHPTLVFERDSWTPPPNWRPADDDPYFATERHGGDIAVSGPVIGAPTGLTPGHYTVALGVAELNDVVGGDRYVDARIDCLKEFDVTFGQAVVVTAIYGDRCQLEVTIN